jgi:hypothetical protein
MVSSGGVPSDSGVATAEDRCASIEIVRILLAKAEEVYLADAALSLGLWLARVQETIGVAARVTLAGMERRELLQVAAVAEEQLGVYGDLCAEALRAAARLAESESGRSAGLKDDLLTGVASGDLPNARPGWGDLLETLARTQSALEPVASALRDEDLLVAELRASDRRVLGDCFLAVAREAFLVVDGLC